MRQLVDLVVLDVPKAEAVRLLGGSALSVRRGQDGEGHDLALGMAGEIVAVKTAAEMDDELVLEMAGHSAAEIRMRLRGAPAEAPFKVTIVRDHTVAT